MIGSVVKVDKLDRVVLSAPVCNAVGIKTNSMVYLHTDNGKVLITNKNIENTIPRKLDKVNRVVIPKLLMKESDISKNDLVSITYVNSEFVVEKLETALEGWKC